MHIPVIGDVVRYHENGTSENAVVVGAYDTLDLLVTNGGQDCYRQNVTYGERDGHWSHAPLAICK